jgi:hypothetical protein
MPGPDRAPLRWLPGHSPPPALAAPPTTGPLDPFFGVSKRRALKQHCQLLSRHVSALSRHRQPLFQLQFQFQFSQPNDQAVNRQNGSYVHSCTVCLLIGGDASRGSASIGVMQTRSRCALRAAGGARWTDREVFVHDQPRNTPPWHWLLTHSPPPFSVGLCVKKPPGSFLGCLGCRVGCRPLCPLSWSRRQTRQTRRYRQ